MTTVAVYFSDPNPLGYPFSEHDGFYLRGYLELGGHIERLGGRMCIARGKEYFLGQGKFSRVFWYDGTGFNEEAGEIQTDVVLNKGDDLDFDDGTTVVNDPQFHHFCNDKPATYRLFEDVSPRSVIVRSEKELPAALKKIPGERVVAKPAEGAGGKGVVIGSRDDILAAAHAYPLILQEFIDTSGGIPGIIAGFHDLRFIIVAGILAVICVKTPKHGALVSNFTQGGTMTILDRGQVPLDAWEMVEQIDGRLDHFPSRFYSVDVGRRTDGEWTLIELNSPPGMNEEAEHESIAEEHELLARLLLREAQRG